MPVNLSALSAQKPKTMSTTDPVQAAFQEAQREFRKKLKSPDLYEQLLNTATVDEVYNAITKLQETTLGRGRLRNLAKIGKFLERLSSYAAVIEVFIQVKPDLLALIWGPIKMLILLSSRLNSALDKVTDLMERIGNVLPQFFKASGNLRGQQSDKSSAGDVLRRSSRLLSNHARILQQETAPEVPGTESFCRTGRLRSQFRLVSAVAWFWLQGIPGAGKSYLSAAAIDHIKRNHHRVLFAFASHLNKHGLTALSIIQSLVFQTANDDDDFKSVLVESKEREIQANTGHVSELLATFLKTAKGPTYIIIDGLDEMEECERQILLHRAEDDICRALAEKGKNIRVQDRNFGSIQNYRDHRFEDWVACGQFESSTKTEIFGLLSPLSANARGMFLYARIILDNLEQMSSIDEIRHELKAFPIDLNDAYYRIFRRINDSKPSVRSKCRRVLGWLACAPTPLTISEMEQALSMGADSDRILDNVPQLMGKVNFIQLCGPIVEAVGEQLQFVHFTVPEYIFSHEIQDYIEKSQANEDLLMALLAYLSTDILCQSRSGIGSQSSLPATTLSDILEPEIDDDEMDEKLLTGQYRLFQYASSYWPSLLRPVIDLAGSPRLENLLVRAVDRGRNDEFENETGNPETVYRNDYLRSESPELYDTLNAAYGFRVNGKRWEWQWANSSAWVNLDPLTTSQVLVRIQERYDVLVSEEACVQSIRYHYGPMTFKSSQLQNLNDDYENLDPEEAQPTLFALIVEDDTQRVKELMASSGGKKLQADVIAHGRDWGASEHGSLAMTRLLAPPHEEYLPANIVISAFKNQNEEFVRWALTKTRLSDCAKLMKIVLGTTSGEIYALWETHILHTLTAESLVGARTTLLEDLIKPSILNSARNDSLKEARLKSLLRNTRGYVGTDWLGAILLNIAKSSCSAVLAEEVLDLGAPVNYPWGFKKSGPTAIAIVVRKTSEEAARLIRVLVLRGADTSSRRHRRDLATEKGAEQILTWLGLTWDELNDEYRGLAFPNTQN
ncbi:NACHT domain protein [Seiridium cupressi]